jgi:hypothetical protein
MDTACHIGGDGQLYQFSRVSQSGFSDQLLELVLLLIFSCSMKAFSGMGEILVSFPNILPWPALLVSEQREATFIDKQLRRRKRRGLPGLASCSPAFAMRTGAFAL